MNENTVFETHSISISMTGRRVLVAAVLLFVSCSMALPQQPSAVPTVPNNDAKPRGTKSPESKPGDSKTAPKPAFTLNVKTKPILNISLNAEKAKLAEIRDALAKRLKIPVFLGPAMEKEVISTEFSELTLEPAMQLLAPHVYIDYEIMTGVGTQPRPLGIFLYGSEAEPPSTAVVQSPTQALLIEGDTEEGVEPQNEEERKRREEQPLRITFANNTLSVKSKKQPLILVLLKIGEQLSIPVDIQYQSPEIVDLEFANLPAEDAIRQLSPSVQMFVRGDLTKSQRRLLRLVLPDPTKTMQVVFPTRSMTLGF
jgi:hypothetical protein